MNLSPALQAVSEDNDGLNLGIGAGGVVGLLVVILLCVAIVYFVRHV